MKIILKTLMVLLILIGVNIGSGVERVEAGKSMVSTAGTIPTLAYFWNVSPAYPLGSEGVVSLVQNPPCSNLGCGWATGLAPSTANVTYSTRLINLDNNNSEISDRASLPVGTRFKVERVKGFLDISWNGTGYSADSPYGNWVKDGGPSSVGCVDSNKITNTYFYFNKQNINNVLYSHINLNVNDPMTRVSSRNSNATCSGDICQVKNGGPIEIVMNFPDTIGRFYYRYAYGDTDEFRSVYDEFGILDRETYGCVANNVPMSASNGGSPYNVNFPSTDVIFYLTGLAQPPDYKASCSDMNFSPGTTLTPGQVFAATVKTKNNGNTVWSSANRIALKSVGTDFGPDYLNMTGNPAPNIAPGGEFQFGSFFGLTAPTVPGTYNFNWRMSVIGFEFGDTCSRTITVTAPPTNGSCGSANGGSFTAAPSTASTCSAGTLSWTDQTGSDGAYNWQCNGSGGGSTASCSATKIAYTCGGTYPDPPKSIWGSDEETGLLSATNWAYSSTDNPVTKCQFTCAAGHAWWGGACIPLPDLVSGKPTLSTQSVQVGQNINFAGSILNRGLGWAGPYNVAFFRIYNDTTGYENSVTASNIGSNTAPNASQNTTGTWGVNAPPGSGYKVMYFADIDDVVPEGSGDNKWSNPSPWSDSFTITAGPPSSPSGLTANPGACNSTTINISWNAVPGATTYELLDGGNQIHSGPANSYAHTVTTSSFHSYSVRATSGSGSSAYTVPLGVNAAPACGVANLEPQAPTASPNAVQVGQNINLTGVIPNNGTIAAGPHKVGVFYLDNNNDGIHEYTVPATDISVNTAPNASNNTTGVWNTNSFPPGTYRAGYSADINNEVPEGGAETNWSGWSSEFTVTATPPPPINGSCGTANNQTYNTAPSSNLCSAGVSSWVSGDSTGNDGDFNWSCDGSNGGVNASCSATKSGAPSPTKDLTADSISMQPSSGVIDSVLGVYNGLEARVLTKNIGSEEAPDGISYRITLDKDSDGTIEFDSTSNHVGKIAGGTEKTGTSVFNNVPFGTYKVCARVNLDPTIFTETYLNNNDTENTGKCSTVTLSTTPPAVMEINSSKKYIRAEPGEAVNIDWRVRAPYDMECTVKGPGGVDISFSTTATTLESATTKGNKNSTVLKNTGVYTLICERTGSIDRYKETVIVEAVPGQPEI